MRKHTFRGVLVCLGVLFATLWAAPVHADAKTDVLLLPTWRQGSVIKNIHSNAKIAGVSVTLQSRVRPSLRRSGSGEMFNLTIKGPGKQVNAFHQQLRSSSARFSMGRGWR